MPSSLETPPDLLDHLAVLDECPRSELAGVDPKCPPLITRLAKGLSKQFLHPLQQGFWENIRMPPTALPRKRGRGFRWQRHKTGHGRPGEGGSEDGQDCSFSFPRRPSFLGAQLPSCSLGHRQEAAGWPIPGKQHPWTPEMPQPLLGLVKKLLCQGLSRH